MINQIFAHIIAQQIAAKDEKTMAQTLKANLQPWTNRREQLIIAVQCDAPDLASRLMRDVQQVLCGQFQHVHYFTPLQDPQALDFGHLLSSVCALQQTSRDHIFISGNFVFSNDFLRDIADIKIFVKSQGQPEAPASFIPCNGENNGTEQENYLRYVAPLQRFADFSVIFDGTHFDCETKQIQIVSIPATPFEDHTHVHT